MESEFIAITAACKETEWMRNFLFDIELWHLRASPAVEAGLGLWGWGVVWVFRAKKLFPATKADSGRK